MLNGKGYVITDPELVSAAFRNRNLSLGPLISDMIHEIIGLSEACMEVYNIASFQSQWNRIVHFTLTGDQLRLINIAGLQDLSLTPNAIPKDGLDLPNLYIWTSSTMTMATTSALYGPKNPWKRDPSMIESYWGFESYMRRGSLERSHGPTVDDMAALEVVVVHGALSNTIPSSYWFLIHFFSSVGLVIRLREELKSIVVPDKSSNEMIIDIARMEGRCPLLLSSFRESHRLSSVGTSIRRVMQDTVLSNGYRSYLLKQGYFVHVPMSIVHVDPGQWVRMPRTSLALASWAR